MSSYVVLARKYRPRTFRELVGQEVVTQVLSGAIAEGRIGQAYLFAGPRGTGKTTTARILSTCINCEQGPTAEPCGECGPCRSILDGSAVDVIEIDAASHTGVDNIRDLRDEAAYAPMHLRRKVYIIDEVHMLSKGAFNALLKTLEEPPEHVVFLFATTEPHKVLDTILSRCQVLRLQTISEELIAARLDEVFAAENVRAEDGLTLEIARGARGGMRDALSAADQLLALAGEEPTLADLRRLGGPRGARELEALLATIESGDRAGVLAAVEGSHGDEAELVEGLLGHLRLALVAAHCGESSPLLPSDQSEREAVLARAARVDPARVELQLQRLLHARERMRTLPGLERLVLEVTLLDLCHTESTLPLGELAGRLAALEARLGGTAAPAPAAPASRAAAPPTAAERAPAPTEATLPVTPAPAPQDPQAALAAELGRKHPALADLLRHRGRLALDGGAAVLHLAGLTEEDRRMIEDRRNQAALGRCLNQALGREVALRLEVAGAPEATPAPAPTRTAPPPAAAPTDRAPADAPRPSTAGNGSSDPFTKEVADLFDGLIEEQP
jgi:DNA polymerase-3 subunit gamma/tau